MGYPRFLFHLNCQPHHLPETEKCSDPDSYLEDGGPSARVPAPPRSLFTELPMYALAAVLDQEMQRETHAGKAADCVSLFAHSVHLDHLLLLRLRLLLLILRFLLLGEWSRFNAHHVIASGLDERYPVKKKYN